jgi:hypothetical protein
MQSQPTGQWTDWLDMDVQRTRRIHSGSRCSRPPKYKRESASRPVEVATGCVRTGEANTRSSLRKRADSVVRGVLSRGT